ncbi:hypothetical protein CCACVL1_07404 [Corchorus capsularis]|uniref:Uncharacterized protein n=1 Tax=Corchorus capsularis TaxID=210143 RepID=A0A1R3J663_COCAP|nr:hypothetical protein CCACVL1_07404 [Corchorus capsularis]
MAVVSLVAEAETLAIFLSGYGEKVAAMTPAAVVI